MGMNEKSPRLGSRYIAFVAASVDGRISLSNKKMQHWTSREDWDFFQKALARSDAVITGRNTYEAAAERLRRRNTFVLSRRVKTLTRRGSVTFVNPAAVSLAKLLEGCRRIAVIGGGSVYRYMLNSGLLDEIYVTVEPLIFGRGKEMFVGGTGTTQLRLLSSRRLNRNGTLLLRYRVDDQQR
jgi:dihydrofolate reductase